MVALLTINKFCIVQKRVAFCTLTPIKSHLQALQTYEKDDRLLQNSCDELEASKCYYFYLWHFRHELPK